MCERCVRRVRQAEQIVGLMADVRSRDEAGDWIPSLMNALESTVMVVAGFKAATPETMKIRTELHADLCKAITQVLLGFQFPSQSHPHANPVPSTN